LEFPASRHFVIHKLGEGIYAAIANDGAWAICNAGIVDLGDRVVVFDTFVNQEAASDLKEAAEKLTGKVISIVVNSHFHSDHVKGNQVFGGSTILATSKTREVMAQSKKRYETESERIRGDIESDLKKWLAAPEDPDSVLFQGYDRGHLEGLPTLKYTLPNATFDSAMNLHGSKRSAQILTLGGGHTLSDAFLYLPDDRVVFMGDLLFVDCHPYIADGSPAELLRILDRVEALDARTFVPGHGPVGSAKDIDENRDYVEGLQRTVEEVRGAGGGIEQAMEKRLGHPFDGWKWRSFRRDNLEFLFQGARPS
jgi:cyclase